MSIVVNTTRMTPEDLLRLPGMESFELVDGQLVEKNMGAKSAWVGGQLHAALNTHARTDKLGWTFPADASYQCFPHDPDQVRKPDASFVRAGRFPGNALPRGHIRIAPDLAAEVVSPNDLFTDVLAKVAEYLSAGVRLVWIIDPELRRGWVYRPQGDQTTISETGWFDGEDVLPGFRCPLAELLPPKEASSNGAAAP